MLTAEMSVAWQEILQACMEKSLARWDPSQGVQIAIC